MAAIISCVMLMGRTTTVPVHGKETLGPGLMGKILRDTELRRDDLSALLSQPAGYELPE